MKKVVRATMRSIAKALNAGSGGRIHPNHVTLVGLLAFGFLGLYILPGGYLVAGGIWIIVFGLFDTLDGELARLQNRASAKGMFLDSVTDRMKEMLVYIGLAMYFLDNFVPISVEQAFFELLSLLVTALGVSMLISYTNAWAEVALSRSGGSGQKANTLFRGGLMPYEVRLTLLALGCFFIDWMVPIFWIIIILGLATVFMRMYRVFKYIK